MTWKTIQSWVQVQQLMCYGPRGNSQAVAALADIMQCIRCVITCLESHHMQRFSDSLMEVATSQCGINRHVPKGAFLSGCKQLESSLARVILDGSETVQENTLQRVLKKTDGSEYHWVAGSVDSMEAFLMYVKTLKSCRWTMLFGLCILSI